MAKKDDELVTLYPTLPLGEATVPGVPATEQTVSAARAAELLAYSPPAFTTDKPHEPAAETAAEPDKEV